MTKRQVKAPDTIRYHLRYLEDIQQPGGPFTEAQKREAYIMATALAWTIYDDAVNPTAFFTSYLSENP